MTVPELEGVYNAISTLDIVSISLKRIIEFQDGLIKRRYVAALRMQVKLDRRYGADGDK